jgi:hypothetical protein
VKLSHTLQVIEIAGLAIWRHAHHFVFAFIDLKPEEGGESGVEQPQGVGETHFMGQANVGRRTRSRTHGGRGPFADAIDRKHRSSFKRGTEERAGGVRHVMLDEKYLLPADVQLFGNLGANPKLLFHPTDRTVLKETTGHRPITKGGGEKPFQLQQRLFMQHNIVEVARSQTSLGKAELYRSAGKGRVVLDPAEAFLLRGGNQCAIHQQCCSGVVVVAGDAKDIH